MKYLRIVLIAILLMPLLLPARTFARWHTSMGSFTAQLFDELVPINANNFKDLANSGFYNNLIFHRVISGFVIQDGCPNGNGSGGPGYTIQDEIHPDLNHNRAGILAMAKTSQPNSAGSQYYITLARQSHLNGTYSVFGEIIEGLDNVLAIGNVPTDANDRPIEPVQIHQLRMLDLQIGELMPDIKNPVLLNPNQIEYFMVEAYTNEAELSFEWYVDDVLQPDNSFLFEYSFPTPKDYQVRCNVASSDSISFSTQWEIVVASSVQDANAPALATLNSSPNPFQNSVDISFHLEKASPVKVEIYNLKGQKLRSLADASFHAGVHSLNWDAKDASGKLCPPGYYIIRLSAAGVSQHKKLLKL